MNFRKGDKSDGVMAYKSMLITAKELGLITQSVNPDNVFGDGTLKATKQVQEKYKLEVDGIAGIKTITALNKALTNEVKALTDRVEDVKQCDRNTVIAEVKQAIKTAIDNVEV